MLGFVVGRMRQADKYSRQHSKDVGLNIGHQQFKYGHHHTHEYRNNAHAGVNGRP